MNYRHLYRSQKWKVLSYDFLKRNPKCTFCGAKSQVTDHITPHKGNVMMFFDVNNLQPLCKRCHDSDKARIELGQVPGKDFVINNKPDDDGMPQSDTHPWNKRG